MVTSVVQHISEADLCINTMSHITIITIYYKNSVYLHIRVGWPALTDCVLLGLVRLLEPTSSFVTTILVKHAHNSLRITIKHKITID